MFNFFLDLIFPRRCVGCDKFGTYLCANCFSFISPNFVVICPSCKKSSIDGLTHPVCRSKYLLDGLISCYEYKGIIKKLIRQFKYKPYLSDLKSLLGKLVVDALIQNETVFNNLKEKPLLVPVPLHKSRERSRGYNHANLLSESISKKINLPNFPKILLRIKNTKPQFKLTKEERQQNILGAFALNSSFKSLIQNQTIFLIDDLATTCSTLQECSKVLKRNGAKKVIGITFARER